MTTVSDRFTVDDSICGFLQGFTTFEGARTFATSVREKYTNLTIYDRMAKPGAHQKWVWLENKWVCKSIRAFN